METMSKSEFARHIRVKPSYITDLNKQGRLVLDEKGRVLVEQSIQRIADTKDPSKTGVVARHAEKRGSDLPQPNVEPESEPEGSQNGSSQPEGKDYQDSRAKREYFAAKREEVAFRKEVGELMETAAVVAAVADAATVMRSKLESLPDLLAPQLIGLTDEQRIRAVLVESVEAALADVSRQFSVIADTEKS